MFHSRLPKSTIVLVIFLINLFIISPAFALKPNDPDYFLQWYIETMRLPQAWDYTQGSEDVIVAVLDTGLDLDHPDLAANVWVNSDEIGGDGVDNDHNGYSDDVHGYDFVDNDADPSPDFSIGYDPKALTHGTIVSGLIGAVGDNLWGISGVAWRVRLMPVRVLDNYGMADIGPTLKGIDYAVANGADIINLSFQGNFPYEDFAAAIQRAYRAGVVVTAAAGNGTSAVNGFDLDQTQFYPVCYGFDNAADLVIGVGAVDTHDVRSLFSNFGSRCLDVTAPGEEIYSTQVYRGPGTDLAVYQGGWWRGTSLSAPIVAGVAALIKSVNKNFSPNLVYKFLTDTAVPIDSLNEERVRGKLGRGRVDAGAAVKAAVDYNQTQGRLVDTLPKFVAPAPTLNLTSGVVVAPGAGYQPEVKLFNTQLQDEGKFLAYDSKFTGGVNLAVADINHDGRQEVITAPGRGGGPHVRIFTQDGTVLQQFMAYDPKFTGGVNVAIGDVDGDKILDIIIAPGRGDGLASPSLGGPNVRVFDYQGNIKYQFMAYDSKFTGGVNLAVGDLNLDGVDEIVTAPQSGSQPVRVFNFKGQQQSSFTPYAANFKGGVRLAVGDLDGDYQPEIITGPQGSGGPHVRVFDSLGKVKNQFFVFYEKYLGGVRLAVGDYNFDGRDELLVARGSGDSQVKVLTLQGPASPSLGWQEIAQFSAFSQGYTAGVNVAIIEVR
ncbi:S8 family serine peptidase [Candidatus Falkowbacteria bacterium]|nr:S8 family serine peptidase [Candidatus Falkowbacteria bacterium]